MSHLMISNHDMTGCEWLHQHNKKKLLTNPSRRYVRLSCCLMLQQVLGSSHSRRGFDLLLTVCLNQCTLTFNVSICSRSRWWLFFTCSSSALRSRFVSRKRVAERVAEWLSFQIRPSDILLNQATLPRKLCAGFRGIFDPMRIQPSLTLRPRCARPMPFIEASASDSRAKNAIPVQKAAYKVYLSDINVTRSYQVNRATTA